MRAQNQVKIKEKCKKSISLLINRHNLGRIDEIIMDTEGWVNPCFFVNNKYVFRFNARDPQLPKYQREKIIFDRLRTSEIPVPDQVILDESKLDTEYDVLISKMLPGENLESRWGKLVQSDKPQIAYHAGQILGRIHSVEFDFFGEIANKGPFPRTKSWIQFLEAKLRYHLAEAKTLGVFDHEFEIKCLKILEERETLFSDIGKGCLIHGDYHFGNLLFKNKQIVGVFDFEWAMSGDPLYDLCRWRSDEAYPGAQKHFLDGYGMTQFKLKEVKRMEVYQMIKNIELSVVGRAFLTPEEATGFKEITLEHIDKLR